VLHQVIFNSNNIALLHLKTNGNIPRYFANMLYVFFGNIALVAKVGMGGEFVVGEICEFCPVWVVIFPRARVLPCDMVKPEQFR
jgi:hypothetical protein